MKHRIFRGILVATFFTAVIVTVAIAILFFSLMENEVLQELEAESRMIETGLNFGNTEYLSKVSDDKRRITLISSDGTVLYDSGADADTLGNHMNREEVKQATSRGSGSSIRFSETLTERTINYAKQIKNGEILRISVSQNYVLAFLSYLILPACTIIIVVVLLSVILSTKVSKNILMPLYNLDLEHPEETEIYEEILPLTQKIQVQNRELKRKIYEELREKQRKQREFTANMTHELKTPLTSISGFAELLMKSNLDSATAKDFAMSIYEEAARMILLVGDIIRLAEMDEREEDYKFEEVPLLKMAKKIRDSLSISAKRKRVVVNLKGEEAAVYGVKKILYEIVYNLMDNAIKYNREMGKVDVCIERREEQITLSVSDTGIGIPYEDQEHIFERFYRVDKSRSRELGGTGLGLSIVREGVLLHNAKMELCSRENEGTEILIHFPIMKVCNYKEENNEYL